MLVLKVWRVDNMNNKEKTPWYLSLIIFSSVPISQIVLYFLVSNYMKRSEDLETLQQSLNMNNQQLIIFQLISALLFSIISFTFIYFVEWILLKLFSDYTDSEALFVVLVLSITIANAISIFIAIVFKTNYPQVSSVIQLLVITFGYYHLTKHKSKTGSFILCFVTLLLNVLPSFL